MTAFPFPRTTNNESNIIFGKLKYEEGEQAQLHYERRHSKDGIIFKSQYDLVQNSLREIFYFVSPTEENAKTFSVNISEVIKRACSLYELVCRWIYPQLFDHGGNRLNISHFLSLEKFTHVADIKLSSPYLHGNFKSQEVLQPFISISEWDRLSSFSKGDNPKWWYAYNQIKHDNSGITSYGTLENAISSVAAIFITLHHVFGPGLVEGIDLDGTMIIHKDRPDSIFKTL